MALDAGVLQVTVEFGKDLADRDWFGKQDPYCVITVGSQTAKTRTHVDGGRNPVWNETFNFNVINDNTIHLTLYDEDLLTKDDWIGSADISCARARQQGCDHVQAPVKVRGNKQKGFVSVRLAFTPNRPQQAYQPAGYPAYPQHNPYAQPTVPYQTASYPPQPGYAYPPQSYPSGHHAPPPQYPPPQQQSGYYPSVPAAQPYGYPPQGGFPQAPPRPGAQPYR